MSESEGENDHFCYYGKPLDPYDEDAFPKKRPISVEDQIATDAQGRRRFHGAFTGGFSAGFFNTVGSILGWTPTEFKSSRSEKAGNYVQKPEDFMDDEDIGEHGIAPQVIKATKEYNTNNKRKRQVFSDGPIPGEPVLHNFLTSGNETVGYMLLRNLRVKDKIKLQQSVPETKQYGCEMPSSSYEVTQDIHARQYEVPEIYKQFLKEPKDNTFGLGYSRLNKDDFNTLPKPSGSKFIVTDRSNKKMSITGQAFGVGAFEEEDTDIYMKDDMSKYDFELTSEKKSKSASNGQSLIHDLFVKSKIPLLNKKLYPPPEIPYSFTGQHKMKRSRFEPVVEKTEEPKNEPKMNPMIRAKYLGEDFKEEYTESKTVNATNKKSKKEKNQPTKIDKIEVKAFDPQSLYLNDRFVSSTVKEDIHNILEPVKKIECLHGTEQMRQAVEMKMFGPLTRITSDWMPDGLLCKRFNVPEPFTDRSQISRPKTKNLIFQSQTFTEDESNLKPGLSKQGGHETVKSELLEATAPSSVELESDEPQAAKINDNNESTAKINDNNELTAKEKDSVTPPAAPQKDITEKLDIIQNQDLFKAIFLSSDDEESEDEKPEEENKLITTKNENKSIQNESTKENFKSLILSDEFIPKIKCHKEGILSGVTFQKISMPDSSSGMKSISNGDSLQSEPKPANDNLYGPKIPEKRLPVEISISSKVESASEDEWVEMDKLDKREHKKLKKHKKDKKHKHKKSKHNKH